MQLNWLSVDFNNWKDWEDDSDEDMSNFDRFSEVWEDEYLEAWVSFQAMCRHAGTDSCRQSSLPWCSFLVVPSWALVLARSLLVCWGTAVAGFNLSCRLLAWQRDDQFVFAVRYERNVCPIVDAGTNSVHWLVCKAINLIFFACSL